MAPGRMRSTLAVTALVAVVVPVALAASRAAGAETSEECSPGLHTLRLGRGSTALMHVAPAAAGTASSVLLVLHDTGGTERQALATFGRGQNVPGLILVAPGAHGPAWSFERGRGHDLATVSRALTQTVSSCRVDPNRIAIGGFGAGATAALSLGVTNGRVFHAIVALAPGPVAAQVRAGRPRVFIAHGTSDRVAPFATTRKVLVPSLRREGYAVTFRTFTGGHVVPAAVARAALQWLLH